MLPPSMARYYVDEAAFDLPDIGLVDRTATRLEAFSPEGDELALRVNRARLPAGKTLSDLVSENVRNAEINLRAHKVLFRRDVEIAGHPAVEIASEWHGNQGMIYTRQAHLAVEGTWIVFSGNVPLAERAACDQVVEHATATFRVRD